MRGQLGVHVVDLGQGVAHPRADGLARPLGFIAEPAVPAAQPGGRGQLADEGVAFGTQLLGRFGAARGVGIVDLDGQVIQPRLVRRLGLPVEHRVGARGADVHALTLVGHELPRLGADPVLDERAKATYKSRLDDLAVQIDDADAAGRAEAAEKLRSERDALIRELAAAAGLGGRDRRLGDETERARKTVSARVRDALSKIERVHPELAAHLRGAVRMGTVCSYAPAEPTTWKVS